MAGSDPGAMGGLVRYRALSAADPAAVGSAVEALREGGLLAHPTATVYGLGGPVDPDTDEEIGRLKGRVAGRPILRLAASAEAARRLWPTAAWSDRALRLSAALWPGPLTLVLPDGTTDGFAVRVESHPFTRRVLSAWDGLLSSSSLNRSGRPPASSPADAERALEALPDTARSVLFIDAGLLPGAPPSTILSLLGPQPRLLREGAVSAARIEETLGCGPLA